MNEAFLQSLFSTEAFWKMTTKKMASQLYDKLDEHLNNYFKKNKDFIKKYEIKRESIMTNKAKFVETYKRLNFSGYGKLVVPIICAPIKHKKVFNHSPDFKIDKFNFTYKNYGGTYKFEIDWFLRYTHGNKFLSVVVFTEG